MRLGAPREVDKGTWGVERGVRWTIQRIAPPGRLVPYIDYAGARPRLLRTYTKQGLDRSRQMGGGAFRQNISSGSHIIIMCLSEQYPGPLLKK